MIIVRITMNALLEKMTEVMQSVLLGTKSLLYEPPQIQIHMVSHSEGMETIHAIRGK